MNGALSRRTWFVLLFCAGALVAAVLMFRGEGETLTREMLETARARWNEHGLRDYDMEVAVTGVQVGHHAISVRGGRVVAMTTGAEPVAQSAWAYWSVDGMFRFLSDELSNAENPQRAFGGDEVVLSAVFDEQRGYPRRFLRHVMGRRAGVEWTITSLTAP